MINLADIFVGSAALVLGSLSILAAVMNYEAVFRLPKAQAVENRFGRPAARVMLAMLGLLLVGIGCAVIAGFAPNAERRAYRGKNSPPAVTCCALLGDHTP